MSSSAGQDAQTFCIFQIPFQAEVQRALALRSQESIFSHQFHLQPIHIVIETSCLVSFFRTKCVLQTTLYFLKAPNAPVDNEVGTNRYIFLLREKWLLSLDIFWNGPIPSNTISKSRILAFSTHPPQIGVS